jgi:hypothetical protein
LKTIIGVFVVHVRYAPIDDQLPPNCPQVAHMESPQFVRVDRCFPAKALDRLPRVDDLGSVDANQTNAFGAAILEFGA